jgi:hypothetical protein
MPVPPFVEEFVFVDDVENCTDPTNALLLRKIAVKFPESEKKEPFPKGFPFLLPPPAWRSEAKASVEPTRKRAREGILGRVIGLRSLFSKSP